MLSFERSKLQKVFEDQRNEEFFELVDARLNLMDTRFENIETDLGQMKIMLTQILERLPER